MKRITIALIVSLCLCAPTYAQIGGTGIHTNEPTETEGSSSNFFGVNITGLPSQTVIPTGNALPTLSSFNVQSSTASPFNEAVRSFLTTLGMVSGSQAGFGAQEGHVTLYTGMQCEVGTGDCWSQNTLVTLAAGSSPGGVASYHAQGIELDLNNFDADRPVASSFPSYGMAISGAAPFSNTAAIIISGATTSQWHLGIVTTATILDTAIEDISNATTSVASLGIHTTGILVSGIDSNGIVEQAATGIGIEEESNAVTGFLMAGTHTNGIDLTAGTYSGNSIVAPGFLVAGATGNVRIGLVGSTVNGVQINGATAGNAVTLQAAGTDSNISMFYNTAGTGAHLFRPGSDNTAAFRVQSVGGVTDVLSVDTTNNIVKGTSFSSPLTTPASAVAACIAGQTAWDTGFIYICTANNTWKRVAIATWP